MSIDFNFISDPELQNMAEELDTTFQQGQEESKEGSVEPPNFEPKDEDDFFLQWDDLNKDQPSITTPKCGGLFMAEDNKIIAFVGTELDAKVNVWSYDPQKRTYQINKNTIVKGFTHQKGPDWNGQFRPTTFKDIKRWRTPARS